MRPSTTASSRNDERCSGLTSPILTAVRSSIVATTLVAFLTVASQPLVAQSRMKPTAPGTSGDPIWQGVVLLSDGRRLVTDGGIAIDAALAKLPKLPEKEFPGKVIENYFSLPLKE